MNITSACLKPTSISQTYYKTVIFSGNLQIGGYPATLAGFNHEPNYNLTMVGARLYMSLAFPAVTGVQLLGCFVVVI